AAADAGDGVLRVLPVPVRVHDEHGAAPAAVELGGEDGRGPRRHAGGRCRQVQEVEVLDLVEGEQAGTALCRPDEVVVRQLAAVAAGLHRLDVAGVVRVAFRGR